jgi:hypothetical protein
MCRANLHYGHLTRDISALYKSSYEGVRALINDVTTKAFYLAEEHAEAVCIIAGLSKRISLVESFVVKLI